MPQKTPENLTMEYELMDFNSKVAARLAAGVEKILGRCMDFYKKVITMHNICHTSLGKGILDFPGQEDHLKYLQDMLQEDELCIQ